MNLTVDLAPRHSKGLRVGNPVMTSAGTIGSDGYGSDLELPLTAPGSPLAELGAVIVKTTTLRPRKGNPEPQMAELPVGWLNSMGLPNPGIDVVLREYAPLWSASHVPVVLSIAGERAEEFQELARKVEEAPGIAALEVNVSCPNIEGGLEFGQRPEAAAEVTRLVKEATSLPVIVKLTPNVTNIVEMALAVEAAGADALTLINTVVGMGIDSSTRRPLIGSILAGLSGPAIKPVALAMVYQVAKAVQIPVIGVGGITTGQDAIEFFLAGASGVQVGSGAMGKTHVYLNVLAGVVECMASKEIEDIHDLIGALKVEASYAEVP